MEAPSSPAVPQYFGCCASNNVVVRAPSSRVGVYVQLRGTQEAVRREDPQETVYSACMKNASLT
ncbi:hypothetical protein IG631_23707 [Alternaria alternata]|nr:hypothetical protein IG631_23707 [Alternaria alternata]